MNSKHIIFQAKRGRVDLKWTLYYISLYIINNAIFQVIVLRLGKYDITSTTSVFEYGMEHKILFFIFIIGMRKERKEFDETIH